MIAEAVDTAIRLGVALLAWIAVLAAAATIVLLAGLAVGAWAWQAVRKHPRSPSWARGSLRARILARYRTRRHSGHTETHDYREAA